MRNFFLTSFILVASSAALAQNNLQPDQAQALKQTQELLKNQQQREKAVKENQPATQADDFAKKIGGANTQEVYNIAAEVLEVIAKRNNGDPQKMQLEMQKFEKDPEGFANSLPAEQRARIKALADKLSHSKPQMN